LSSYIEDTPGENMLNNNYQNSKPHRNIFLPQLLHCTLCSQAKGLRLHCLPPLE